MNPPEPFKCIHFSIQRPVADSAIRATSTEAMSGPRISNGKSGQGLNLCGRNCRIAPRIMRCGPKLSMDPRPIKCRDGKIFITSLDHAIRIRTDETGTAAL